MVDGRKLRIRFDGGEVSGNLYGEGLPLLLAHGAGTDQQHPRMVGLAQSLARRGCQVLTFNYPYTEAGRKRPDRPTVLLSCHRAARDLLSRRAGEPVVMAGRSMGGRMATYLAAEQEPARALVLYAYPLHPAGRPDQLRVDHLAKVTVPMLFFQGTRDSLSRIVLFERYIRPLPGASVEILAGATHSLDRTPEQTDQLAERTCSWLDSIGPEPV
jgi:predicted alpha/beta-hydrolase family hydrolase